MLKYYASRELAVRLEIPLAKWKRWAREFLPPDPLGGYRSGYARQYSLREAFRVYLGGHLVGCHRFTIPESRRILKDLDAWLDERIVSRTGFPSLEQTSGAESPPRYRVRIRRIDQQGREAALLTISIQHLQFVLTRSENGGRRVEEGYREDDIGEPPSSRSGRPAAEQILDVSAVVSWFAARLKGVEDSRGPGVKDSRSPGGKE
ncbi:MAG: hypothetical protein ACOWWM_11790 [Desulfobacterales bacterium]